MNFSGPQPFLRGKGGDIFQVETHRTRESLCRSQISKQNEKDTQPNLDLLYSVRTSYDRILVR
jgi:hypothetical protein